MIQSIDSAIEVLKAHKEGKKILFRNYDEKNWHIALNPEFDFILKEYAVAPLDDIELIVDELEEEAEQWEKRVFAKLKSYFTTALFTVSLLYILWHGLAIKVGHFELYTIGFKFKIK